VPQDGSPRFLITRLSAVGDCIHTMPLATALRERFPAAFIAWAVQQPTATLLSGHPAVDEIVRVDRRWMKSVRGMLQVRKRLKTLNIDTVLDPQGLTKSSLLGRLSGASRRIGFAAPHGRELSRSLNRELVTARKTHVVERYLELLRPLGAERPAVRFGVPIDDAATEVMQSFAREGHLGRRFAVVNPGAGWDSKLWPAVRFGKVARFLGEEFDVPTAVTWAGPREEKWAEQIVRAGAGHAVMAPPTTLPELAALCREARLFVGSDTGPLHLAAAVGTPCIALFGPTKPEICGPYGHEHISLQAYYQDGTCRQRRGAANDAMREISVEDVCRAAERMLGGGALRAA